MKKIFRKYLVPLLFVQYQAQAQFSSGSIFHIVGNTDVSIDGLLLKPTASRTMANKTITVSSEPIPGKPHNSIQRVYTFNEPLSLFGSVGIHYQTNELNENNEAALQIAYYNEDERYVTTSQGTVDAQKHMVFQSFFGKDLLKITAVEGNSTLPVTLVAFSAKRSEQQIILSWNTTAETNSDYFEVQRSMTGKTWETLGRVEAVGESKVLHQYTFHDNNPNPGNNLYRLKMADTNGSYSKSQIQSANFDYQDTFKIFPNPCVSTVQITIDDWSKVCMFEVISRSGVIRAKLDPAVMKGPGKKIMDLQSLEPDIYVVRMVMEDGSTRISKLMKN